MLQKIYILNKCYSFKSYFPQIILKKESLFHYITFTFSHVADAFIQSNLQMRTMEAIKINKKAICKCYNKSQLA